MMARSSLGMNSRKLRLRAALGTYLILQLLPVACINAKNLSSGETQHFTSKQQSVKKLSPQKQFHSRQVSLNSSHQVRYAIERAARLTGVPRDLLLCVAWVESGIKTSKGIYPWPWAINHQGRSRYFLTQKEALDHIKELSKAGEDNIDVGVMQLNLRWNKEAFRSLEEMLDIRKNILYAAKFLKKLRKQHGTWAKAVAAYHSLNRQKGQRYIERVASHLIFKPRSKERKTLL